LIIVMGVVTFDLTMAGAAIHREAARIVSDKQ
jgi:hypothetical protein